MSESITRREAIKTIGKVAATAAVGLTAVEAMAGITLSGEETNSNNTRAMKVLLINGSPRRNGNTNRLLEEVAAQLKKNGVESEIFQLGAKPVRGCIACGKCGGKGKCVFDDDVCNGAIEAMEACDAIVVGSPVYYGTPAGQVLSLLQRMAYAGGRVMRGKPAAAITVCRRGGATAAFQTLQMPFQMLNMPIVTSQYWNIAYGGAPGEAAQDAEGLQTMRTLADNLAYMLHQFATGTASQPERERPVFTNFIR